MNALVFRAALRATARVAFTAAIVGCGGTVSEGNGDAAKSEAATGKEGSAMGTDAMPGKDAGHVEDTAPPGDSGLMCNAPLPSSLFDQDAAESAVSDSMFNCCIAELEPLIGGDSGLGASDAEAADPNLVACCGVLVFAADNDHIEPIGKEATAQLTSFANLGNDRRSTCCDVLKEPSGPTCTPWGPPMPPAIPGETASSDLEVA
jgi:hypothetical protein